jgi:hypothetical protein
MDLTIGGPLPPKPDESNDKKNIPQWHPTASGNTLPGISKKEALQATKKVIDTQYVESHVALQYLATSDWIEPLFKELEHCPLEVQEKCCEFLEGFGVESKILQALINSKNYEGLKDVLPKGEEIALRLLGKEA